MSNTMPDVRISKGGGQISDHGQVSCPVCGEEDAIFAAHIDISNDPDKFEGDDTIALHFACGWAHHWAKVYTAHKMCGIFTETRTYPDFTDEEWDSMKGQWEERS